MREAFFVELFKIFKKDKNAILITGDLGYRLLDKFRKELPKQFINAGIAEQNMMSVAAGLALEGKKVFVYSIANFPVLRCLEQIRNDVAYHNANVKIISAGVGFDYGTLGYSHHATEDIAVLMAIPNISIISPFDNYTAKIAARYVYKNKGSFYVRLSKDKINDLVKDKKNYDIKKPAEIIKGEKIAIFSTGAIIQEAIKTAEILSKKNIKIGVYGFAMIKPIDKEYIRQIIKRYDIIFTLEEHRINGGFGSKICNIISESNNKSKIIKIGLDDKFNFFIGDKQYLMKINKVDKMAVKKYILKIAVKNYDFQEKKCNKKLLNKL